MKNIWENPEIQCLNRLPMRSPLFPYPDAESARAEMLAGPENSAFTKSPFVKSLDGRGGFECRACRLDYTKFFRQQLERNSGAWNLDFAGL